MIPAREALARLREGNVRFVSQIRSDSVTETRRRELAAAQSIALMIVLMVLSGLNLRFLRVRG